MAMSIQKGCAKAKNSVRTVRSSINAVVIQRRGSGILGKKTGFLWVKRWPERKKDGILGVRCHGQREAMECARLKAEEAGWEVNEN